MPNKLLIILTILSRLALALFAPEALLDLKTKGDCKVILPDWLFELDYPGHTNRKVKSVSMTIPCVTGPYTNVCCTLSLTNNVIHSKSIATSSAQNDAGVFELNFRDERYLPFEGAEIVESEWTIDLSGKWPKTGGRIVDISQFDFNTISDVIMHVKYTAKEIDSDSDSDSDSSMQEVIDNLPTKLSSEGTRLYQILNLQHDFPNEWHHFLQSDAESLLININKKMFPYFVQNATIEIISTTLHNLNSFDVPVEIDITSQSTIPLELTVQKNKINSNFENFIIITYRLGF